MRVNTSYFCPLNNLLLDSRNGRNQVDIVQLLSLRKLMVTWGVLGHSIVSLWMFISMHFVGFGTPCFVYLIFWLRGGGEFPLLQRYKELIPPLFHSPLFLLSQFLFFVFCFLIWGKNIICFELSIEKAYLQSD